ncbi:MAG: hypothetical protein Q4E64_08445 [Phascolarctobacterium sp.]|uniref:hypothetical protein n=1 Tax=Phascolarctobacterium sp. TaxID=2049039 RepID=UPI0026DAA8BB|nr:hypothetical protein [Phascolarctobacterium sp.]MDO4921834.1 hypothetical protein [Phascolarctobacterium sp.]
MRKNLLRKIMVSVLAAAAFSGAAQMSSCAAADDNYTKIGNGNAANGKINIIEGKYLEIQGYSYAGKPSVAEYTGAQVYIGGSVEVKKVFGAFSNDYTKNVFNNEVIIDGNAKILGNNGYGVVYGAGAEMMPSNGKNIPERYNNTVTIKGNVEVVDGDVYGALGNAHNNTVNIEGNAKINGDIYGGSSYYAKDNYAIKENTVNISGGSVTGDIVGGITCGGVPINMGSSAGGSKGDVIGNIVNISGGYITGRVIGGLATKDDQITDNKVVLRETGNVANAALYGSNFAINDSNIRNNTLLIDGWSGAALGAYNFSGIDMQNIAWQNGGTVLSLTGSADDLKASLANTQIKLNSVNFNGGKKLQAGESMTLVTSSSGANLGITQDNVKVSDKFVAGVGVAGSGEAIIESGKVAYKITEVTVNKQVNLVAENRAVAAAFVNQGSDLISDGLLSLTADAHYGVKTFAAVYGNRSKYDVNSDLKINGWSGLFGVGASKKLKSGDLSWGVFFENGSGNYRTFNSFNDDFFRGDGSLVYNGGGAMLRYKQENGVYTEGSLRAGMLKSEMKNALRDGVGNSYGYKTDTAYYGAHVGLGRIYNLSGSSELDIYGKYFHTYNASDSFTVADDKFSFDSVTSDRLQIGARLTANKQGRWTAYYGLAWEYEFNGDADMRVQNLSAPTQSLQGSTYIGEIGVRYAASKESPWSLDAKVRGYAGEREGFSGNVQVTYNF